MRTVEYENKTTSAKTDYRKVSVEDKNKLLDNLRDISKVIQSCKSDPDMASIYEQFTRKNSKLLRTGTGAYNSIDSAVAGILDNFTEGTQYDFSDRTARLIDQIFEQFNATVGDVVFERIIWKQVDRLPVQKTTTKPTIVRNVVVQHNQLFDFGTIQDNK